MKRVDQVKPSEEEIKFIFEIIDIDGDGKITLMEATKSAQLLKDRFGVTEVRVKLRFTLIHLVLPGQTMDEKELAWRMQ